MVKKNALKSEEVRRKDGRLIDVEVSSSAILEEALCERKKRYQTVAKLAQMGVFRTDTQGNYVYVNNQLCELTGHTPEQLYGLAWTKALHPMDSDRVLNEWKRAVERKIAFNSEYRFRRPDSVTTWVIVRADIETGNAGEVTGYVGTVMDITDRRRAEEALRESEDRYRGLVENAKDIIFTLSSDGAITSLNPSFERVTGLSRGGLIGMDFSPIVHPVDLPFATELFQRVMNGETTHHSFELRILSKPFGYITLEITVAPKIIDGKMVGALGIGRDITERKRAEKELQQSREKYRTLINNIQDGVFIIQDDKIQFVNEAFAGMCGYTTKDVIGKDFREFVAPEDLKRVEDRYLRRQTGKNIPKDYEFHMLHRDGKTRIIVNMNVGLIPYYGRAASMGTVKDITERKKAEEIRIENERLAYASKAKSEFLTNMSHELRTPLNAIIGFSELMKQGKAGELNEKQEHYIDNIFTSGKFLLGLISDILDLSKIETGKIELLPKKISVPANINESLTLIKEKAVKHNVRLKTQLDPALDFIEADKLRFKQILFNLLSNAVKFSKEDGGTVTITTKKEGDMARISISDTGIGIKKKDVIKLFHKFQQIDTGISRKYGGTGLGLAISKQLVELHGGKIWAESRCGRGSTFTFLLPLEYRKK